MNILDTIVARKHEEIQQAQERVSVESLENEPLFARPTLSITEFIQRHDTTGVIAEFKRQSPSKGIINNTASVEEVVAGYCQAGASAVSVLTDRDFFGGSCEDIVVARTISNCPILRKDFMVDEYQVLEAKALGADVILLIAAVLDSAAIKRFGSLAQSLGMEVLLEVHDHDELQRSISDCVNLIGVNNRNLKTFVTDVQTSYDLIDAIPNDFIKVSESGISQTSVITDLRAVGYQGFLIGENFMRTDNPAAAAQSFMQELL